MVSFDPIDRQLERLERGAAVGERYLALEINQLEIEVLRLPDSERKRELLMRLANLNGQLQRLAGRARSEYLAEARRMRQSGR